MCPEGVTEKGARWAIEGTIGVIPQIRKTSLGS